LSVPQTSFHYRLRLEHEGGAGLSLQRPGRTLRFDPARPVRSDDIVILTAPDPERTRAASIAAVAHTVVAPQPLLDALRPADGQAAPATIDGVKIELIPYEPAPVPPGALIGKAQGAAIKPGAAAKRLLARARAPRCAPQVTLLTFPGGERLAHLNLSIHRQAPAAWLADVQARAHGVDWLVIGVAPGQSEAVLAALPGFAAKKVLFTDFVADTWRGLGRPVELLTPTADRAIASGVEGYVCVSQASYRFE